MIDSYSRLPVGKYEEIHRIAEENTADELDRQARILAVLSGLTVKEIYALPITEYKEMVRASRFLEVRALTDEGNLRYRVAKSYRIGDFTLVPVLDFRKLTTAQYVDFQTFAPQVDTYTAALLSVLLVPKGKPYNEGYDIEAVQAAIREGLSVADAAAVIAFFFISSRRLIEDTLNFSAAEARRMGDKTTAEKITKVRGLLSRISGVGSPTWIP